jgi:hypothetical protein
MLEPELELGLDLERRPGPEPEPESTIATSLPRVHRRPVTPPHTATAMSKSELGFQSHTEQEHTAADQVEQARPAAEKAEQERIAAGAEPEPEPEPEPELEPEPEPTVALSLAAPESETTGSAQLADSASQSEPTSKATGALPVAHLHAASSVGEIDCDIDFKSLSNQQLVAIVKEFVSSGAQSLSNQQLVAIVKEFVSSGAQSPLLADLLLKQRSAEHNN